eukprot:5153512-Alexandrium_andersonii.AAC.1
MCVAWARSWARELLCRGRLSASSQRRFRVAWRRARLTPDTLGLCAVARSRIRSMLGSLRCYRDGAGARSATRLT